jgi:hypothetical protein
MRKLITLVAIALLGGLLVVFNGAVDVPHFKNAAHAQGPTNCIGCGFWGDAKTPSGGGGASIAALTSTTNAGGPTSCPGNIATNITFSSGLVVLGVTADIDGGFNTPTGFTINGVSATQIGSTITDSSSTVVQMWYASGVAAGSGSVAVACSVAIGNAAISLWTITGNSSGTPTANSSFNGLSSTQADPQGPLPSLTVASGGVAAIYMGAVFHAATTNPTTWLIATRDATAENANSSGNTVAEAGAHISASGTYTGACGSGGICASGGSVAWQYSGMIGAAWH